MFGVLDDRRNGSTRGALGQSPEREPCLPQAGTLAAWATGSALGRTMSVCEKIGPTSSPNLETKNRLGYRDVRKVASHASLL